MPKYFLQKILIFTITLLVLWGCSAVPTPQAVTAESIDSVQQTSNVITNEISPWIMGIVILLAGWAIPSPAEMFKGVGSFIINAVKLFKGIL